MQLNKTGSSLMADAIALCVGQNLTFAAYRLPNQYNPVLLIQSGSTPRTISREDDFDALSGFVVAPFSDASCCRTLLIEPDLFHGTDITGDLISRLKSLGKNTVAYTQCAPPEEVTREEYLGLLHHIMDQIHRGIFEKVVPSRVKIVKGTYDSKMGLIFSLLCQNYPNAFVYVFHTGDHTWIGATPEPFLLALNGTMQTVSLAGTRPFSEENQNIGAWNSKERLEQEYVTRYISRVLSKYNLSQVEQQGPYTKIAGNLLHLRTDFTFYSKELKGRLGRFLNDLHPTPAVCGMPYQSSLELLIKLEKHNREYYAGFLGPVGLDGNLSLFVNLRCMKVFKDKLALYVGGGITADSVPEDEWTETEIKADTLLAIIQQLPLD
jgi:isochorismate synthase